MSKAHDMDILRYDQTKFHDESPCATHWKTQERIRQTTAVALAEITRADILKDLPW